MKNKHLSTEGAIEIAEKLSTFIIEDQIAFCMTHLKYIVSLGDEFKPGYSRSVKDHLKEFFDRFVMEEKPTQQKKHTFAHPHAPGNLHDEGNCQDCRDEEHSPQHGANCDCDKCWPPDIVDNYEPEHVA